MDGHVRNFLLKANLQEYIPIFEQHEIDHSRLLDMPESMINELFPKLYPRHQFLENQRVLKEKAQEYQQQISQDLNIHSRRSILKLGPINSVEQLLKKTAVGRMLLVKCDKELDKISRRNLTEIIIDYYVNQGINLYIDDFIVLAKEIKQLFPKENEHGYFLPFKPNSSRKYSSGKLWDKYYNMRRMLKRLDDGKTKPSVQNFSDHITQSCVFPNCINVMYDSRSTANDHIVVFHKFPKNEHLKKRWANICRLVEVKDSFLVCSDHFTEEDYEDDEYGNRMLKKKSMPANIPRPLPQVNQFPLLIHGNNTQSTAKRIRYSTDVAQSQYNNTSLPSTMSVETSNDEQNHSEPHTYYSNYNNDKIVDGNVNDNTELIKENQFLKSSLELEREVSGNLQTQINSYQKYVKILQSRINELDERLSKINQIEDSAGNRSPEKDDEQLINGVFIKEEEENYFFDEN